MGAAQNMVLECLLDSPFPVRQQALRLGHATRCPTESSVAMCQVRYCFALWFSHSLAIMSFLFEDTIEKALMTDEQFNLLIRKLDDIQKAIRSTDVMSQVSSIQIDVATVEDKLARVHKLLERAIELYDKS